MKPAVHIFDHVAQPDPVRRAAWKDGGPSAVSVCLYCGALVAEHKDTGVATIPVITKGVTK